MKGPRSLSTGSWARAVLTRLTASSRGACQALSIALADGSGSAIESASGGAPALNLITGIDMTRAMSEGGVLGLSAVLDGLQKSVPSPGSEVDGGACGITLLVGEGRRRGVGDADGLDDVEAPAEGDSLGDVVVGALTGGAGGGVAEASPVVRSGDSSTAAVAVTTLTAGIVVGGALAVTGVTSLAAIDASGVAVPADAGLVWAVATTAGPADCTGINVASVATPGIDGRESPAC